MSDRIFQVKKPHMTGKDVREWQRDVKKLFAKMKIDCPIKADGNYGIVTRSFTAALVHANGMSSNVQMRDGVSPELRIMLRHAPNSLNASQKARRNSANRKEYRAHLRKRWGTLSFGSVHSPTTVIVDDTWGFHPGVHDGLDVITPPDPVIFAMVKAKVIDVRSEGWWNLGAPSDPSLKAKGDGIIQLQILETVGPFKKGYHIGYGHAEKAQVHVGQVVHAGQAIGHAGFANAWHIHLMINDGKEANRGVGTVDPRPCLNYSRKHSFS